MTTRVSLFTRLIRPLPSGVALVALVAFVALVIVLPTARGAVVFETTSVYHHIRVVDQGGRRTLSFDGSQESRMSLSNPLAGHFAYTEFFHMPLLWNPDAKRILLIGLGGASTQRAYQHFYPDIELETVEIDSKVLEVAERFFHFKKGPRQKVHLSDGRVFLRRSRDQFDIMILDAYSRNRYGSFIPYHLATREFFELAKSRLTGDGVLAYNVMGTLSGWRADIIGSMYRTMKAVFPQVYLFPAPDSRNIVMIATRTEKLETPASLRERMAALFEQRKRLMPTFGARLGVLVIQPPPSAQRSGVLSDDFAPIDNLLQGR